MPPKNAPMAHLTEPARQTPVFGEFDVVVLGGGPAGIAAAASAAGYKGSGSNLPVKAPARWP